MKSQDNRTYKILSIYVDSPELFDALRNEARTLWYKKYGESLSNADILKKGLSCLIDTINKDLNLKSVRTIESIYERIK